MMILDTVGVCTLENLINVTLEVPIYVDRKSGKLMKTQIHVSGWRNHPCRLCRAGRPPDCRPVDMRLQFSLGLKGGIEEQNCLKI